MFVNSRRADQASARSGQRLREGRECEGHRALVYPYLGDPPLHPFLLTFREAVQFRPERHGFEALLTSVEVLTVTIRGLVP